MFRGIKSSLKNLKIILFLMKIFKHNRNKHVLVYGGSEYYKADRR